MALGVMRDYQVSQRRACVLIGVDPKTVRRERPPDHGAIREAMREIAGQRRLFGYRRIGVMLGRKGMSMNHKKLYRLYREEGLSVRRRCGRERGRGSRTPVQERAGIFNRKTLVMSEGPPGGGQVTSLPRSIGVAVL
ncbi:transposase IS3/IS911 family protein [Sphingomonas sp. LH128]|nr:transposase IS3/IS911 family protein [Sphingomonas sp. LH128]